ncbi:MAG: hypothetical protein Unbinned4162contig1001_7 [Prokaryotic dsDNA virus sp.]|nr:MAG: hypothetical protein Unbinned4162contig1001_7 [Prokaryotic dsDNA virus sp.]|tara:strand:+ start:25040 stop:25624 length:585 start_codon:yes stop_codon:yes gene_type:complete
MKKKSLAVAFAQSLALSTRPGADTQEGAKEEKKEKAPKPERITQNDVTRPLSGTLCGQVWDKADEMSKAKGAPVAVADLLVETDKLGLNPANVRCEYSRWRKFHGVTGRIKSEAQIAKDKEREAEKARKAEEKAAKKKQREEEQAAKKAEREAKKAEREAEKKAKAEEKAKKEAEAKAKKEADAAAKAAEAAKK